MKTRMYNLTYRVRKKYPDLKKNRSERILIANRDLAIEVLADRLVNNLIKEYGFAIQIII